MSFRKLIRSLRKGTGKSMSQVARENGISPMYYSEVEGGRKPPFPPGKFDYTKLAETLNGCDRDLLLAAVKKRGSIEVHPVSESQRQTAVMLASKLSDLSPETLDEIQRLLDED